MVELEQLIDALKADLSADEFVERGHDYEEDKRLLQIELLKLQAWLQKTQPRLLVLWGKYDLSFELSEPEAYRHDVPNAEVHLLDAGHFALDTAADEIAQITRGFLSKNE